MENFIMFMLCKCLILILVSLSTITIAVNDDEIDVQLLDNQNAPLFATLDMSKANSRVKEYVREAVETKMEDVKGTIKDYVYTIEKNISVGINDKIRSIVEEILKGTVKPMECADIDFIKDGVFMIYPKGKSQPKHVYCILQENRKWTVIQRRFDFSVNFTKSWTEYKEGFGQASGEHWLGNEYIHALSTNGQHTVRFNLGKKGTEKYAEYSHFRVESEQKKYMLDVSGYSGTAGDCIVNVADIGKANGQPFSTYDQDNDNGSSRNCADVTKGGWWYNNCDYASLNSMMRPKITWVYDMGYNLDKSSVLITRK